MNRTASFLVLHGVIVVLLGLLVGFAYASAITDGWGAEAERAWRTAHLEGLLNGMLVMVLGAAAPRLRLSGAEERWFRLGALATGYGNVVAATLAAVSGSRGLAPGGPLANWAVFALFSVAIVGVLVALILAVRGAARVLREAR
jgi:cytochrome bd-type quinol oxidase subunit 2